MIHVSRSDLDAPEPGFCDVFLGEPVTFCKLICPLKCDSFLYIFRTILKNQG